MYCQIPSSMRVGSTYLNSLISSHSEVIDLGEFLNISLFYTPHTKSGHIISHLDNKSFFELTSNYELFNEALLREWNDDFYYLRPFLVNGKIKIQKYKEPIIMSDERTFEILSSRILLLEYTTDEYIVKLCPLHLLQIKEKFGLDLFDNFLTKANMKFIGLTRHNLLDVCISAVIANNTGRFQKFKGIDNPSISKKSLVAKKFHIESIIKSIILYKKLCKYVNLIEIEYEELINHKNDVLKKLGINNKDILNHNKPQKMYKNISTYERLSWIKNTDLFLKWYNEGLIKLSKEY